MTFYDFVAPVYGIWAAILESRAHRLAREALATLQCGDLLEVATGTGTELGRLSAASVFRRSVGVDFSAGMLKRARKHLARNAAKSPAWLCQADARALPFRAESFDALLNCYMIDLLPEPEIPVAMREFRRVLRPGGRLVLVTMARQSPAVQRLWMALYRRAPLAVGGCRPLDAAKWLRESDWKLERQEQISQMGFRSELIVAQPLPPASGA
jgi:ubiquinone/menaquinone biosynthesis C-methylase UbiE